jgi:hypothetical protein
MICVVSGVTGDNGELARLDGPPVVEWVGAAPRWLGLRGVVHVSQAMEDYDVGERDRFFTDCDLHAPP